ncbi:MAG: selenocysteine lyase, partial [Flavobacteriaceae bacterium]|nr:selenocysteine lyase [Flavobacteriaceae bacterium]
MDNSLERHFDKFRKNIVGINQTYLSPFGEQKMIYADWTASGRLYQSIEEKMLYEFGPFVANTHTETTFSGSAMTMAYHEARNIIKKHVNAGNDEVLITESTGMTGVINKFQRILGLRIPENLKDFFTIPDDKKPVVF